MVIKRSDLAKQFELVVQQEIINHNKQIEASNQALQKIQMQIDELIEDDASHIARLENYIWDLEENYKSLKKKHEKLLWRIETQEKHVNEEIEKVSFDTTMRFSHLEETVCDLEDDISCLEEMQIAINTLNQVAETQKFYIHSQFYDLKKSCERMFAEFKQEIEDKPSEIPKLREDLEKKIKDAVVDARGVLREVEIVKKEAFVMKKKIEQVYALLGRDKDGGEL